MFFVGIDLAWSPKRSSAVAIATGDDESAKVVAWRDELLGLDDIMDFVGRVVGKSPALIAVDAPLVVPNRSGMRACDVLASAVLRPYKAVVLPVNRSNLGRYNGFQGEGLVSRLEKEGYSHQLFFRPRPVGRSFFEMYPHASAIAFFQLSERLMYKSRGSRRPLSLRLEAYREFQRLMGTLKEAEPPLVLQEGLIEEDVARLRGRELKAYEDLLDALICSYTAYFCWYWGGERVGVVGSRTGGYLVLPLDERIQHRLETLGHVGTTRSQIMDRLKEGREDAVR